MIEAICFDMDGILFDTERLSVESWIAVAEKLGLGNIEKGIRLHRTEPYGLPHFPEGGLRRGLPL